MKKLLLVSFLAFFLAGCSSFNREWKSALGQPRSNSDISGAWEGRWLSAGNGHTGKLRGVFTKTDAEHYNVHFHATFWKIFHATYQVPLKYEEKNGEFLLTGEQDLGKLSGGVYKYEARATPAQFSSTYTSKYDHGTFDMKRPEKRNLGRDVLPSVRVAPQVAQTTASPSSRRDDRERKY